MKLRGLLVLSLIFGIQTVLAKDCPSLDKLNQKVLQEGQEQSRGPSSVKEMPESTPTEGLEYESYPDDLPWGAGKPYRKHLDWDIKHIDNKG